MKGDYVGIEIEYEFSNRYEEIYESDLFQIKEDGSLRDGFEIVSKPLLLDSEEYVSFWEIIENFTESNNIATSIRTSCHVHVNVSDLTSRKKITGLISYLAFFNLIQENLPNERVNNLFCLPFVMKCDNIPMLYNDSEEYLRYNSAFDIIFNEVKNAYYSRYFDCNLNTGLDTFEFRFLWAPESKNDIERIKDCIRFLVDAVRYNFDFEFEDANFTKTLVELEDQLDVITCNYYKFFKKTDNSFVPSEVYMFTKWIDDYYKIIEFDI